MKLGLMSSHTNMNVSPFAQIIFAPEPIRPECRSPRVRSPTRLECTRSVRPYSIYTMAYDSCVMLKIQTVHTLKSVHISSIIFKN